MPAPSSESRPSIKCHLGFIYSAPTTRKSMLPLNFWQRLLLMLLMSDLEPLGTSCGGPALVCRCYRMLCTHGPYVSLQEHAWQRARESCMSARAFITLCVRVRRVQRWCVLTVTADSGTCVCTHAVSPECMGVRCAYVCGHSGEHATAGTWLLARWCECRLQPRALGSNLERELSASLGPERDPPFCGKRTQ